LNFRLEIRYGKIGSVTNYKLVVHQEPAGGFWAEVPSLPGCYTQGETVSELLANAKEAIAGVLEVMRERGELPEDTVQILDIAV